MTGPKTRRFQRAEDIRDGWFPALFDLVYSHYRECGPSNRCKGRTSLVSSFSGNFRGNVFFRDTVDVNFAKYGTFKGLLFVGTSVDGGEGRIWLAV